MLRRATLWLLCASLGLSGCSRALLKEATSELDQVYTELAEGPAPDPGKALGPQALLASAQRQGPDFLAAEIEEARARIQLDGRKSERLPRLSLALRSQYAVGSGRAVVNIRDSSIAMDWNVAAALFYGDRESIEIAQAYLPVQAKLAEYEATGELFDAYLAHEEALVSRRELSGQLALAQCRADGAQVEYELGNASQAELEAGQSARRDLAQQMNFAHEAVGAARREVLFRAGMAETATLRAGRDPSQSLPDLPKPLTRESCYSGSGNALRDRLLLAGAASAIRAAKLQRYGSLDVLLPADLSPETGLNLNVLLVLLLPIVDQGDGDRRVQEARSNLLEIALAAERNRRSFDTRLSQAQLALSRANSELTKTRLALKAQSSQAANAGQICESEAERRELEIDHARAQIAYRKAKTSLALLCAKSDVNGVDFPDITSEALSLAAPRK